MKKTVVWDDDYIPESLELTEEELKMLEEMGKDISNLKHLNDPPKMVHRSTICW